MNKSNSINKKLNELSWGISDKDGYEPRKNLTGGVTLKDYNLSHDPSDFLVYTLDLNGDIEAVRAYYDFGYVQYIVGSGLSVVMDFKQECIRLRGKEFRVVKTSCEAVDYPTLVYYAGSWNPMKGVKIKMKEYALSGHVDPKFHGAQFGSILGLLGLDRWWGLNVYIPLVYISLGAKNELVLNFIEKFAKELGLYSKRLYRIGVKDAVTLLLAVNETEFVKYFGDECRNA